MFREAFGSASSARITVRLAVLALLFSSNPALADDEGGLLYKWEDAQGQVHYSDRPPAGPVGTPAGIVESYARPRQAPAAPSPEGNYYSVENQARRLEQARLERERARAAKERERQEAELRAAKLEALRNPPPPPVIEPQIIGIPVLTAPFPDPWGPFARPPSHRPDRPSRPPGYHRPHPRPERPDESRPVERPGASLRPWRR